MGIGLETCEYFACVCLVLSASDDAAVTSSGKSTAALAPLFANRTARNENVIVTGTSSVTSSTNNGNQRDKHGGPSHS